MKKRERKGVRKRDRVVKEEKKSERKRDKERGGKKEENDLRMLNAEVSLPLTVLLKMFPTKDSETWRLSECTF